MLKAYIRDHLCISNHVNYFALEIILVFLLPGIKLFILSDYRVQFVVYFAYINLQISFAFLIATYFSKVRTASGMLLLECLHFCLFRFRWF